MGEISLGNLYLHIGGGRVKDFHTISPLQNITNLSVVQVDEDSSLVFYSSVVRSAH